MDSMLPDRATNNNLMFDVFEASVLYLFVRYNYLRKKIQRGDRGPNEGDRYQAKAARICCVEPANGRRRRSDISTLRTVAHVNVPPVAGTHPYLCASRN